MPIKVQAISLHAQTAYEMKDSSEYRANHQKATVQTVARIWRYAYRVP